MKNIIEEYGKFIICFIVVVSFFSVLYLALDKGKGNLKEENKSILKTNEALKQMKKPTLLCNSSIIAKDTYFDPLAYVSAKDGLGNDISQNIKVYGKVDTALKGGYDIRYAVRDRYGIFNDKTVTFIVD